MADSQLFADTDENRAALLERLRDGPVWIRFTKRDGTLREMQATLAQHAIEWEFKGGRPKPDSMLSVWDVELSDWRSFQWKNLVEVAG